MVRESSAQTTPTHLPSQQIYKDAPENNEMDFFEEILKEHSTNEITSSNNVSNNDILNKANDNRKNISLQNNNTSNQSSQLGVTKSIDKEDDFDVASVIIIEDVGESLEEKKRRLFKNALGSVISEEITRKSYNGNLVNNKANHDAVNNIAFNNQTDNNASNFVINKRSYLDKNDNNLNQTISNNILDINIPVDKTFKNNNMGKQFKNENNIEKTRNSNSNNSSANSLYAVIKKKNQPKPFNAIPPSPPPPPPPPPHPLPPPVVTGSVPLFSYLKMINLFFKS